ncbi:MAG TPA: hypothetical protein VFQ67_10725 [Allosphingosinicella sp.]|nr:hypothetical protein [Allosphingosinicella sp.]
MKLLLGEVLIRYYSLELGSREFPFRWMLKIARGDSLTPIFQAPFTLSRGAFDMPNNKAGAMNPINIRPVPDAVQHYPLAAHVAKGSSYEQAAVDRSYHL